jgi:indolepyruvate ferredoxin oxidoreductase
MPVLSPAGVQEILDFGIYGYGLSRFAGVWAGLKLMKDTAEATAIVDGRPERMSLTLPDFELPEGGLNIRLVDDRFIQESRMLESKRFAAEAYARANGIDRRVHGKPGAKIGFVAAGKNWLDLVCAQPSGHRRRGGRAAGPHDLQGRPVWPLDMAGFNDWAEGLDLIVVVEEKRKLIEVQVKEAMFDNRRGRRVYGYEERADLPFPHDHGARPGGDRAEAGAAC